MKKNFTKEEAKNYAIKKSTDAIEMISEMMIKQLENFQGDWKKPWFCAGSSGANRNLSGREYNGMNQFILWLILGEKGYKYPIWATHDRIYGLNFKKNKEGVPERIKDNNGKDLPLVHVKKGEKSYPVFITVFSVKDNDGNKMKYEDYRQLTDGERDKWKVYPSMQIYNVFNIEQTNMKEERPDLWEKYSKEKELIPKGDDFSFAPVDNMIAKNLWICPIKPTYGDDAYYSISKDTIVIPEKSQFKDGESFYSNLFHEMAHSTGAESRLNRLKKTSFGSKDYAQEELVAEMTAAVCASKYGMEKHIKEDSIAYLKNWIDSIKETPAIIKTILLEVKRASSMIQEKVDAAEIEDAK